jgi:hypothetical protein
MREKEREASISAAKAVWNDSLLMYSPKGITWLLKLNQDGVN